MVRRRPRSHAKLTQVSERVASTGTAGPSAAPAGLARWIRAGLGPDTPSDLALVVATFVVFTVVEHLVRAAAVVTVDDLPRASLVAAAAGHRWWALAALGLAGAAAAVRHPGRLLAPWPELEQGRALRLFTGALVVILAWQASCYRYNWLADRLHGPDRLLVVLLGVAALAGPAFLVPFAVVVRIVAEQFVLPFDTPAGRNIDDLLVLVVLAVAAGHLLYVATGRNRTAPVLLVAGSALAAHFFIPGKGKVVIGWLAHGDLANLPLSSWTAGWLAGGDGGWARSLAGFYQTFRLPVMAATLALELGSIVAVTRPRLLRWWLPGAVVFHLMTFATTGFWFVPWIVVEVGLLALLAAPSLREWAAANATPARGLVAVAAVLGAPVLFHPPGLAWLDAPVSYGYRIEATGVSGTRYQVPASALAPLSHHVAFDRLQLETTALASGAYGAMATAPDVDALEPITTFAQLDAYELALGPPAPVEPSQQFLADFLTYAHRPHRSLAARVAARLGPPEHFWTSAPDPATGSRSRSSRSTSACCARSTTSTARKPTAPRTATSPNRTVGPCSASTSGPTVSRWSPTREHRRPLLQEAGHPLLVIGGGEQPGQVGGHPHPQAVPVGVEGRA